MTSEPDIWRSAHVLIREHGEEAFIEAAMRAYTMLERGNIEGCMAWKQILRAVVEIQREHPRDGERHH
jgi:hypothetical protein